MNIKTRKLSIEFRQHVGPSDEIKLDFLHVSTLDKLVPIGMCSPATIC